MRIPVNTVIHTTLVGLEPATFRSLVDCWSDALPVVPPTHGNENVKVVFRADLRQTWLEDWTATPPCWLLLLMLLLRLVMSVVEILAITRIIFLSSAGPLKQHH